ncbi:MAG: hypothetical protein ACOVO2_25085 [Emticicia sp.]|uniref:hypothetical protein n=1 Tax=Emticicia sp. TaxID=1930953 RepID=UPI003BA8177F
MENPTQDKSNWLQELSNQSWNLELVVSGAAIFSTSFLPEFVDKVTFSYFENYQFNTEISSTIFPNLAFSFAKAASYLLIFSFFIHFILRAFWIALVGLRAVYPKGIDYDKLPNTNNELKGIYKNWFGSFDDYIVRLDKNCSRIFSIAFIMVLFSVMISVMYLVIFISIILFKTYNADLYAKIRNIAMISVVALLALVFVFVSIMNKEKYRDNPVLSKWFVRMVKMMSLMYFGMFKPLNYIGFVFASHIPHKTYYRFMLTLMLSFSVLAMVIYTKTATEHAGIPFMEPRSYYSTGSADHKLNTNYYDNLRSGEDYIWEASIQADIIQEPFIKLFINYNKVLDAKLTKIYKEPKIAENLDKHKKRLIKDKARLDSFGEYFKIAINDSTLNSIEFFYDEHGAIKTKGLTTYLSSEKCKIGRNTLHIKALQTDSLPKKVWSEYITIPFWYAKD